MNAYKRTKKRKKRKESEERGGGKPTSMLTKFRFCLGPVRLNVTGALSHCSQGQKPKHKAKFIFEKIVFVFQKMTSEK